MREKKLINIEKGITLIALIITIIILLILAGVSVSMITGDEGILKKAKDATIDKRKAEIQEEIELAIISSRMEAGNYGNITESALEVKLSKLGFTVDKKNPKTNEEKLPWTVRKEGFEGFEFIIDVYGNIKVTENNGKTKIWAEMVEFTPTDSNWKVENVQQALDYLYERINNN